VSRTGQRWRWVLFGLAAVLLAGFGVLSFGRRVSQREPYAGVQWAQGADGPTVALVDPGSPGAEAGLIPGDHLVTAGGRVIVSAIDAADLPWRVKRGEGLELTVRRGEATRTLTLRPSHRHAAPPLYAYLAFIGVACFVSGLVIVFRWPTVRGAVLYGALGLALFAHLVLSQTGAADLFDWVVHWADILAGALVPALLLRLAWTLSRRSPGGRVASATIAYAPAALIVLYDVWLEGRGGAYRSTDPIAAVAGVDRLEAAYLAIAVAVAGISMARAFVRTSSALHRSQLRWMLWGLAVGFGPFTALYVVPWVFTGAVPAWSEVTVLGLLAVPAAFTAAMARYRLHDLDLILRRGLAACVLAAVTIGAYALSLALIRRLMVDLDLPIEVLGFLAALVTAVLYPTVRTWVRKGVDRAFYRARYSYRATLLEWMRELGAETDLASLLERLEERIRETLAVPSAAVLVRTGPKRFERLGSPARRLALEWDRATLEALERNASIAVDPGRIPGMPDARHLFAMRVKGRVCAVLAVAERTGFEPALSSEDRGLLVTLCAHASTAIESARLVLEVRQHAAEVETLKALQERILESSGVGLLLVDGEQRILAWNRTLEEIYALPREQAIGKLLRDVFPLHTVRRVDRELAAVGPDVEARIYRHALVNRAGERLVVNLVLSPIAAERAEGSRVVTFDDITSRVVLEEQVQQQERLASLGLLAAGVAHEVNTPLTGISSYAQLLLEETPPGDPRHESLRKIEEQTRRASRIANSLLNLARPERTSFEALHLNDAVLEVVKLFEPQLRDRRIALEAILDPALPPVRGHRGKLQQVLLNLLSNARDAVEGGGRIVVRTSVSSGTIALEVVDDGVGIAEEDLPRIFDPFFSTKGRGKGTGLGLSISYGIVREHEGTMHVESVAGSFTRFRVELPLPMPPSIVVER
jgi:two-component system, NtrC family, sensor kinase